MKTRLFCLLPLACSAAGAGFELAAPGRMARIVVPAAEPECVRLAATDLANDVQAITGRAPAIIDRHDSCKGDCVVIASAPGALRAIAPAAHAALAGKWEAYRAGTVPAGLLIAGSDERGAMFGIYAFAERYLGVDPMYYWTDRAPPKRSRLAWNDVRIEAGEPSFRFRGWFINDEDLLAEFRGDGGKRHIEYPFYHQVTSPALIERAYEAMLRLQYNLVIPASFTDIANPDEERMVRAASRRGLFVSMHHVEPLGVSGFAFQNYWRLRGRSVPFSFFRQGAELDDVWRFYAARWARYPNVVWQLGLRGIADRPVWVSDPSMPQSEEARGKLISDAIVRQWEIVRSVDRRAEPLATTTLWMEGSDLNRKGFLKFPPGVAVVFADNSPGWKLQADFYETPREPGRNYGIYYHHALWGSGPHLVQGVPPQKTHEIFKLAVERGSSFYAILNVSNVREFALGIDASARMLRDFGAFDPDRRLGEWCRERFGAGAAHAERAYRGLFASYAIDEKTGTPALLDGQTVQAGRRVLSRLLSGHEQGDLAKLIERAARQRKALEEAGFHGALALKSMSGPARLFFETNFIAQHKIILGLTRWLECALRAAAAPASARQHVRAGLEAFAEVRAGQALAARGPWKNWYHGDRKMNLDQAEAITRQVLEKDGL